MAVYLKFVTDFIDHAIYLLNYCKSCKLTTLRKLLFYKILGQTRNLYILVNTFFVYQMIQSYLYLKISMKSKSSYRDNIVYSENKIKDK